MQILKNKQYQVTNPKTRKTEVWSGERILVYQNTYGGAVKFPAAGTEKKVEKAVKKTTTKRTRKIKKS